MVSGKVWEDRTEMKDGEQIKGFKGCSPGGDGEGEKECLF